MTNLMDTFEKKQIERLTGKKRIPTFRPGDTLKVTIIITEGDKSRLQAFEGMCIARKNNSVNSNFTVRKISHGEGVERVFPLFSPIIEKIEVVRKGGVRRAKLYYLQELTGKRARIADRDRGDEAHQFDFVEDSYPKDSTEENKENIENPNIETNISDKVETEQKVVAQTEAEKEAVEEKASNAIADDKNPSESVVNKTEQKSDEQQS